MPARDRRPPRPSESTQTRRLPACDERVCRRQSAHPPVRGVRMRAIARIRRARTPDRAPRSRPSPAGRSAPLHGKGQSSDSLRASPQVSDRGRRQTSSWLLRHNSFPCRAECVRQLCRTRGDHGLEPDGVSCSVGTNGERQRIPRAVRSSPSSSVPQSKSVCKHARVPPRRSSHGYSLRSDARRPAVS
jgi:hypothetical protein